MYKVLICDDEIKICNLLRNLIDWNALNLKIISTADNGLAALSLINELSPDIVITDISMPGCNGIDMIRQAKTACQKINFIIISGYKEFDYAQSAIKYGVEDYLLKPIDADELTKTLKKITEKIDSNHKSINQINTFREEFANNLNNLQSQMLPFLLNSSSIVDISDIRSRFGVKLSAPSFAVFFVKPGVRACHASALMCSLLMQKIGSIVEKILSDKFSEVFFTEKLGGICILVNETHEKLSAQSRTLQSIIRNIHILGDIFPDIHAVIGISSITNDFSKLKELINEAVCSAFERILIPGTSIVYYNDLNGYMPSEFSFNYNINADFSNAIEYLDTKSMEKLLNEQYSDFMSSANHGYAAYSLCINLYKSFILLAHNNCLSVENLSFDDFNKFILVLDNFEDMFHFLKSTILTQMCNWREKSRSAVSDSIQPILQYINQNYALQITLEKLGGDFGFNPTYLSQLFKQETGKNFKDYLFETRMNNAKRLLQSSDADISDISKNAGYNDTKHFSRLFKKYTGLSPKEYKKIYHVCS